MGNKIWSVRFRLDKNDTECYAWRSYSLSESRCIVKELKSEIEDSSLSPVNTWILEYNFRVFDNVYKKEGYTLIGLSVTDKRKTNVTKL